MSDDFEYVGITLWDILKTGIKESAGGLRETNIQFNENIIKGPGFHNKKVILFLTWPDTLIECILCNRKNKLLFETIQKMGIWAMVGSNFSVMVGECAFAQALNQKRSLYSSFLGEKYGILAIPHVYAITKAHIERWIKWFEENPSVHFFQ